MSLDANSASNGAQGASRNTQTPVGAGALELDVDQLVARAIAQARAGAAGTTFAAVAGVQVLESIAGALEGIRQELNELRTGDGGVPLVAALTGGLKRPVERKCLTCGADLKVLAAAAGVSLDPLATYCGPECDPNEAGAS